MNAEALAAALAAGDVPAIVATIRAWTSDYRVRPGDPFAFGDALPPLATHPEARVRQAVAEAADLFPTSLFEHLVTVLGSDPAPYVSAAMKRSAQRLASRHSQSPRASDEQGLVLAAIFDEAEKKHGKSGRRIAERAARRSAEYFVRRMHHETTRAIAALGMALSSATTEGERRDMNRAEFSRAMTTSRERLEFLTTIVNRARFATKTEVPTMRDESLASIVIEAKKAVVALLGARADALDMTLDVDPALVIRADRTSLVQVFENLLANGAQAHAEGAPRITLSVTATSRRLGSEIEIVVRDGGQGMNDAQRATMFMPFGSLKPGGTGLGLVIVRNVIEHLHGGALHIDSEVGKGTNVTLVLPARGRTL